MAEWMGQGCGLAVVRPRPLWALMTTLGSRTHGRWTAER